MKKLLFIIFLILAGRAFAIDEYYPGDSVVINIWQLDDWTQGDTLVQGHYPDSCIILNWYLNKYDTTQTPDDFILIRSYVCMPDSFAIDYPIKPFKTSVGKQAGYYQWYNRADFAGVVGIYTIRWSYDIALAANKVRKGMYSYKVVPVDTITNSVVIAELKDELRNGLHWEPLAVNLGKAGEYQTIWNGAKRDSILNNITDAGKLGTIKTDVGTILGDVTNIDAWNPAIDSVYTKNPGTGGGIDSTQVYGAVVQVLVDSTSRYQGQAAGITEQSILDKFSGEGAQACSIWVLNSDTTSISACQVRVNNNIGNTVVALWRTDANGLVVYSLDNGNYKIIPFKPGYTFSGIPYAFSVTESTVTDTIFGAAFDPGSPSSPDLCRVYGNIWDLSGDSLSGVMIRAKAMTSPLKGPDSILISPYTVTDTSDSAGAWSIDLYPSANLIPNSDYEFWIYNSQGTLLKKTVTVPDTTQWQLTW